MASFNNFVSAAKTVISDTKVEMGGWCDEKGSKIKQYIEVRSDVVDWLKDSAELLHLKIDKMNKCTEKVEKISRKIRSGGV